MRPSLTEFCQKRQLTVQAAQITHLLRNIRYYYCYRHCRRHHHHHHRSTGAGIKSFTVFCKHHAGYRYYLVWTWMSLALAYFHVLGHAMSLVPGLNSCWEGTFPSPSLLMP